MDSNNQGKKISGEFLTPTILCTGSISDPSTAVYACHYLGTWEQELQKHVEFADEKFVLESILNKATQLKSHNFRISSLSCGDTLYMVNRFCDIRTREVAYIGVDSSLDKIAITDDGYVLKSTHDLNAETYGFVGRYFFDDDKAYPSFYFNSKEQAELCVKALTAKKELERLALFDTQYIVQRLGELISLRQALFGQKKQTEGE